MSKQKLPISQISLSVDLSSVAIYKIINRYQMHIENGCSHETFLKKSGASKKKF